MLQILVLCLALGSGLSQDSAGPQIIVNDVIVPDQSERMISSGSTLSVRCHGDEHLLLRSSSFKLKHAALGKNITLPQAHPRHTGTYTCAIPTNQSTASAPTLPSASVHLYVSDPLEPFVVSRSHAPSTAVGQDFLLRCLPTDPALTELSIQSEADGRSLPQGMTFTFDPRHGALIHKVQKSFQGSYRCRGRRDGKEVTSNPIHLWVEDKLEAPPSLSVSQNAVVRLVGEIFEVTCLCSNRNHFFSINWTHPQGQVFTESMSQSYSPPVVYKNKTLTLDSVRTLDSGLFTCTAWNEVGVSTATTHLEVTERAFIRVFLLQNISSLIANATGEGNKVSVGGVTRVKALEGQDLSITLLFEAYPPIRSLRWVTPYHMTNSSVSTEEQRPQEHRAELKLLIGRVHHKDSGFYSLLFSNNFFKGNISIHLRVHYPPVAELLRLDSGLVCRGSGFPLPSLTLISCPRLTDRCDEALDLEGEHQVELDEFEDLIEDKDEESVERTLTLLPTPGDVITVMCLAVNRMGKSRDLLQIREPPSLGPFLIGSCSVAVVLLLLLALVLWKWRQTPRYEIRWKIIESCDGNNYTFIDPSELPYDQHWEFPRDHLRLGAVLGSGAFGKVVAATAVGLDPNQNETTVAVKMLKPRALSEEREALMSELKILSYIGFHQNIVNLLGACTTGGPMLMITEYCHHGDLLNFLRTRVHHFLSEQEMPYKNTRLRSDSGISCGSEDHEMKALRQGPRVGQGLDPVSDMETADSVSVLDLMRFSLEVAQGLDFLSSKNCIHRDVAARNVLLSEHRIAKICDFGLARDIRNDDSYIVKGNARLPVKWMSPESIFLCVYTIQSDVWSYGVLLWEIFSLGRSPYPNVAVDSNFYRMIKDGVHMERPYFAPNEMYELMTCCWDLEPTRRPTFSAIGQIIARLLSPTNHTPPTQNQQAVYGNLPQSREEKHNHTERDCEVDEEPPRNIYQLP
uniref:receptor protein-tyrosine kinase n=1 Tax=Neogobius melanostomus TaxID=47308 RepID=A0A8C6TGE0_9GOBI